MNHTKLKVAVCALACLGLASGSAAQDSSTQPATKPQPQEATPQGCSDCHNGAGSQELPGPPHELLSRSVHAGLDCTACHQSISMEDLDPDSPTPHGEAVEPIDCGECHDEAAEVYVNHGRLEIGKDPDLPTCWSCHGAHDILPTADTHSRVHPINLPRTCEACHTDVNLIKTHEYLHAAPIRLYEYSVHGEASQKGRYMAATCNDCHSALDPDGKRTAHRILGAGDSESPISFFNIPDTCGTCHESFMKDYWDGIHGKMVKRGKVAAPVCTTCHGEHGIIDPRDPRSRVNPARVAEATCSPCHESEVLNEKYGWPEGDPVSYVDSYHGLKSEAGRTGEVYVANCASCHGSHRILPHTDPASSIHPDNLQATCGECHEEISVALANVSIHEAPAGVQAGWPHFFRMLYLWLIAVVIGLMLLHNGADLVRHVKNMRRKPSVVRMTPNETLQHWLLTVSFIVLVISGFSLRFSEAFWVQWLFDWGQGKGFLLRGTVHRVAAVVFIFCCVWHIWYLFTHRGRRTLRDIILAKRDFADIKNNALFFLGARAERPRFARFSYMEKAEYWAVIWGGVIMAVTGIMLWFDNYFIERWNLPKGVLDVMLVIHYYEAWLATLAIIVWHGYSVIFSPHVYPTNPAWIAGRMPKDMYAHEHPEGPKLKARVQRVLDEEEEEAGAEDPSSSGGTEE